MKQLLTIALLICTMTLSSCDKRIKESSENPLTAEWNTPYGIPPFDEIRDEHYAPALKYAMAQHLAEIDAIATNTDEPTFDNVMLAYDRSGELLSRVSLTFEMICAAESVEGDKYGMYQLDKELAARTYTTPSPLATTAE